MHWGHKPLPLQKFQHTEHYGGRQSGKSFNLVMGAEELFCMRIWYFLIVAQGLLFWEEWGPIILIPVLDSTYFIETERMKVKMDFGGIWTRVYMYITWPKFGCFSYWYLIQSWPWSNRLAFKDVPIVITPLFFYMQNYIAQCTCRSIFFLKTSRCDAREILALLLINWCRVEDWKGWERGKDVNICYYADGATMISTISLRTSPDPALIHISNRLFHPMLTHFLNKSSKTSSLPYDSPTYH